MSLAKDLSSDFPRGPHETLGGFVIAARTLDKCRSLLAGKNGEYKYDCPLDNFFFGFAQIDAGEFKDFVAGGADDDAVAQWIREKTSLTDDAIKIWNMRLRQTRPSELPLQLQLFLEGYIQEVIPSNRRVYTWFDIYDLEEGRI